jgi:uncharacterized protein with PIN domain
MSEAEKRILLTKDRGLLKRRQVTHGYLVRGIDPDLQIREVLSRFDLYGAVQPFTRCLSCNGLLEPVDKATVAEQIPADVGESSSEFRRCAACGKVYWRGSHYEHLRRFVEAVLADRPAQ